MSIKKMLMPIVLGVSLINAASVFANPGNNANHAKPIHHHFNGLLSKEQKEEMRAFNNNFREEMRPLIKEKMALKMQLKGMIATPQMQWTDMSKLVQQINENNAKITIAMAKTQLASFQKFGVIIPLK